MPIRSAVRNAVRDVFKSEKHPAVAVLSKFGTNAHCWIPGIGYFNGLQAGNFIDSAGTQAGLVDNPVGLVSDAANTALGSELYGGDISVSPWSTLGTLSAVSANEFTNSSGAGAGRTANILTIGKVYSVALSGTKATTAQLEILSPSGTSPKAGTSVSGSFSISGVFYSTSQQLYLRLGGNDTLTISSFSVREVTGAITATQGTTANKPILRRGTVNLLLRSEEFDNAAWGKTNSSISQNTTTSPTEAQTADSLIENTATSTHRISQTYTKPASAIAFTFSIYLKANTRTFAALRVSDTPNTSSCDVAINLSTGAIDTPTATGTFSSPSAQVTNVGNGWYRLSLSGTSNTDTSLISIVYLATSLAKAPSYLGDGTSGIYVWGAQLELGSTASEYIPTTTAAASSASGNWYWQFDGSNDQLVLSSVPFQLEDNFAVVAAAKPDITSSRDIFSVGSDVSTNPLMRLGVNISNYAAFFSRDDALATVDISGSVAISDKTVFSARKISNARVLRTNGMQVASSATATSTSTFNKSTIGVRAVAVANSNLWHGSIFPVIAIKGTVSDADLLILERWVGQMSGVGGF